MNYVFTLLILAFFLRNIVVDTSEVCFKLKSLYFWQKKLLEGKNF